MPKSFLSFFVLATLALAAFSQPVNAATFNVDTTNDTVDADIGDNNCADSNGDCSLRAAIQEANELGGDSHTINLPAGTYSLGIAPNTENPFDTDDSQGDLDIATDLEIIGAGSGSTIVDGNDLSRVFHVCDIFPIAPLALIIFEDFEVGFSGLTIRNGLETSAPGGGIAISSGVAIVDAHDVIVTANEAVAGGGIYNLGDLEMTHSVLSNNASTDAGRSFGGGGILNANTAYLIESRVEDNTSQTDGGGIVETSATTLILANSLVANNSAVGNGGGVNVIYGGVADIINSTISGNEANGDGGGLHVMFADAYLRNATVTNNTADADGNNVGSGGGIAEAPETDTIYLRNSIIAGNHDNSATEMHPDCSSPSGNPVSEGYNLIGDNRGCANMTTATGDQIGDVDNGGSAIDPDLGSLSDNGGATRTHALSASSPAVDAGNPDGCTWDDDETEVLTEDQRESARPTDGDADGTTVCDIGAFELGVADLEIEKAITSPSDPADVAVGVNITYTLTITNNGPTAATNVTAGDVLPDALTFVSAVSEQGNCSEDNGTIQCAIGSLDDGETVVVTIVVTINEIASGTVTNDATVSADEVDPDLSNNSDAISVTILVNNPSDPDNPQPQANPGNPDIILFGAGGCSIQAQTAPAGLGLMVLCGILCLVFRFARRTSL